MPKRSVVDPEFFPRGYPKKKHYSRSASSILQLMGVDTSPCKAAPLIFSNVYQTNKFVTLSTPSKGALTNSISTPNGTVHKRKRVIECDRELKAIFLEEDKALENTLRLPSPNKWVTNHSPIPQVPFEEKTNIKITKKSIDWHRHEKRFPDQSTLMQISAKEVTQRAEIETKNGAVFHWCHFISFAFKGNSAQTVSNLGLATNFANGAMELINAEINNILCMPPEKNPPKALFLDVIPEWVEGFKSIRLLKSITMIVKSRPEPIHSSLPYVKVTFNALSTSPICLSEPALFKEIMHKKFLPHLFNDENLSDNLKPPAKRLRSSVRSRLSF